MNEINNDLSLHPSPTHLFPQLHPHVPHVVDTNIRHLNKINTGPTINAQHTDPAKYDIFNKLSDKKSDIEHTNSLSSPHTIITICMLITFDVVFIGLFYFLFIVKKEKEVITHELDDLVNSICGQIAILPKSKKEEILQSVKSLNSDKNNDQKVIDSNKALFSQAIKVFALFIILSTIFIIIVSKKYKVNLIPIAIANTVLLLAIVLTELVFIYQINSKYIGLDSNLIKKHILTELKKP